MSGHDMLGTEVAAQVAAERTALELLATGADLKEVLTSLCLGYEAAFPGMICSVLLLDAEGKRVRHGAAPSLPAGYWRAIDGEPIGLNAGSCGHAAYTGENTFVSDIAVDPRWLRYRDGALAHGLRACWSVPVRSSTGRIVATFALYYREPRSAEPHEVATVERGAHIVGVAVEHDQLARALRERTQHLELALQTAGHAVWRWDLESDSLTPLHGDGALAGVPIGSQPSTGADFFTLLHPEDRARVERLIRDAVRTGDPYHAEFRLLLPDGVVRWVAASGRMSPPADDRPPSLTNVDMDVTWRKEAEIERERLLAEAEAAHQEADAACDHLARVLERVNDGFVALDRDWRYTYVNPKGATLLGRTKPEDLLGRHIWTEYPEGIDQPFAHAYRRALDTQETVVLEEHYGPWDRWFENRIYPSPDGLTVYFSDITERERTRAALAEQSALLSAIVDTTPAIVYVFDMETRSNVFSNDGTSRLLGYEPGEIRALGSEFFPRLVHPDDLPSVLAFQASVAAAADTDILEIEYRMRHAGGTWRTLRSYERPFRRNADGSVREKIGVAIDVTDRRQAEDELRRLNADLERRVEERTLEIEARNRELETFTYTVSHDLKAPVRSVDGYAALLLAGHASRMDEEARSLLENVRRSALQMSLLIEDLLAYSRVERRALKVRSVRVPELVERLLAERAHDIGAGLVHLDLEVPDGSVRADPEGLALAIRNLLDNALKFTRGRPSPSIAVGGYLTAERYVLSVRDNGIGFDMAFHDRIFEVFQRLHPPEDYPGTGIGLGIVRRAMERMGGRVWAESEPGQGATFFLEIPL